MAKYLTLSIFALVILISVATKMDDEELGGQGMKLAKTCLELLENGYDWNGVHTIYPNNGLVQYPVEVYCDQTTDGGGWTVFQRRMNGEENFYRNWKEYKLGFGNVDGEFWLGNDLISNLILLSKNNELRVDIEQFTNNQQTYAVYQTFRIGDESELYKLTAEDYIGNAGDALDFHNGRSFSTYDYDHDNYGLAHCAALNKGGWWYNNCYSASLNGRYLGDITEPLGISWYHYRSLKCTEMKFRAK